MKNSREGMLKERQRRERNGGVRYIRNPHRDRIRRKEERNKYNSYNSYEGEYA